MKKILSAILAACMMLSLTGCGLGKKDEPPEYVAEVSAQISSDLASGEFYLDGDLYQFPVTVQDFLDNGYSYDARYAEAAKTFKLNAGGVSTMFILCKSVPNDPYDKTHGMNCQVYNPTDKELPLSECSIGRLTIDAPADMMFPGGLWSKGDYTDGEAIIAAYGEPKSYENDSDTFYTLVYDITMKDGTEWEVEFFTNNFSISHVIYKQKGIEW